MKLILLIFTFFPLIEISAEIQNYNEMPSNIMDQMDKMGVDDSPALNAYESAYLNAFFKGNPSTFDFSGKKVHFLLNGKCDKKTFFDKEKERIERKDSPTSCQLYVFNEAQKLESGGCDAVIILWSKFILSEQEILKRIKRGESK